MNRVLLRLCGLIVFAGACGSAGAQITCQKIGDMTNCTGIGPGLGGAQIPPIPVYDYSKAQAEREAAEAQAELARAQAAAIRQQTEANERQQAIQTIAAQSDSDLQAAAAKVDSMKCGLFTGVDCASRDFLRQAVHSEIERRGQSSTSSHYIPAEAPRANSASDVDPQEISAWIKISAGESVIKLQDRASRLAETIRNNPPGSDAYKEAEIRLQIVNAELDRRHQQ